MARVPRKTEIDVTVRPQAANFQAVSQDTFDAGTLAQSRAVARTGARFDRLGAEVNRTALQVVAENNETETKEMDVLFSQRMRELGYGDDGFYGKEGTVAIEAAPAVKEAMEKARQEILERGSNDRVKQMFGESSAARVEREFLQVDKHTANARITAQDTVAEARMQEAAQDAAMAWNDDKILNRSLGISVGEAIDFGERKGWKPEVIQSKVEEARTNVLRQAITAALRAGDTARAKEIIDERGNLMDGPVLSEVKELVRDAEERGKAQAATAAIMSEGLTEAEALNRARAIRDPELQDQVVTRLKTRYAEKAKQEKAVDKAIEAEINLFVQQGGSVDAYWQQNPEKYARFAQDSTRVAQARKAEKAIAEGRLFASSSDGETLAGIMKMSREERLAEFGDEGAELKVRADLTQTEWNRFTTLLKSDRAWFERKSDQKSLYLTLDTIMKRVAPESLNIGRSSQTVEQGRLENQVRSAGQMFVEEKLERNEIPTVAEMTKFMQDQFLPIRSGGWAGFFQDETILGDMERLTDEERKTIMIPEDEIPNQLKTTIERKFQDTHGRKPSTSEMENFAGAWMSGDRERARNILGVDEGGQVINE